jgi:hypothetical protein
MKATRFIVNKLKMRILLALIAALVGAMSFCCMMRNLQQGVHKLLMPATYELFLPSGDYQIWYFWQWPSKALNTAPQDPQVRILGCNNELAFPGTKSDSDIYYRTKTIEGFQVTDLYQEKKYFDRPGTSNDPGCELFEIKVKQSGTYKISSPERAVVAIVPWKCTYIFFDHDDFFGSLDDLNFETAVDEHKATVGGKR